MKELFELLMKSDITPNGLFLLHSIDEGVACANYINVNVECYILKSAGFIEDNPFGGYTITTKGQHLLRNAKSTFKINSKKSKLDTQNWETYIKSYTNIFPEGLKSGTVYSWRSSFKELKPRFEWFFTEYPEHTWDDVLKATQYYVKAHREKGDLTFMMLSRYFVKKEDRDKTLRSELAEVINNLKTGNISEANEGYHYFGP